MATVQNPGGLLQCSKCGNFEAAQLQELGDLLLCEDCEYQASEDE
jgi:hypothetical protein